jgi:serine/threonine-protein kinase HipA
MISVLRVLCNGRLVGKLAERQGNIMFQYDTAWLESGFDLAPGAMPFDGHAHPAARMVFQGLHGAFNDSLPDGWGLLLMDRSLKQHQNLDRSQITPLDRLAYMGHRGMGALEYQPELLPEQNGTPLDLADIAMQAEKLLHGETPEVIETLRICGGSPGGARPKVTVAFSENMARCVSSFGELPEGYSHWLVKFRNNSRDGEADPVDMGRLEMAYADMARAAGLQLPATHLIELAVNRKQEAFFAVQRFDRDAGRKIHFLSLAGYAYADHRVPCLDYSSGVLAAARKLTKSDKEVENAFRLMLFNVLAHNKDDHAKNFAYLLDPAQGLWKLAPAYDLTFNNGMANSHTTAINGSGNPTWADLKQVATERNVKNWRQVLEEVRSAVSGWPAFARHYGVTKARIQAVETALRAIDKVCSPSSGRAGF